MVLTSFPQCWTSFYVPVGCSSLEKCLFKLFGHFIWVGCGSSIYLGIRPLSGILHPYQLVTKSITFRIIFVWNFYYMLSLSQQPNYTNQKNKLNLFFRWWEKWKNSKVVPLPCRGSVPRPQTPADAWDRMVLNLIRTMFFYTFIPMIKFNCKLGPVRD